MSVTPAPWTYGVRRDGSIWVSFGTPLKSHAQFDWPGSREDDVRLAMASPDLLAALKAWVAAYDGLWDCSLTDEAVVARHLAVAAIRLAETGERS